MHVHSTGALSIYMNARLRRQASGRVAYMYRHRFAAHGRLVQAQARWRMCMLHACSTLLMLNVCNFGLLSLQVLYRWVPCPHQRYYQQAAVHPVDPQPAPAPAEAPQPPPQPAPRMAIPLPQPQPAPQPARQPLPQQAAPLSTAPAQVMAPAGLYLGHGVMPLPQRLLTKILNLEFIEMQDLLPEAWLALTDDETVKCCSTSAAGGRKRRPPVTNIFTWLQGFASLTSALSTKYPAMVPEFMAYQSTIIKCYKDYDGLGWVQYDRAFSRPLVGGRWPSRRI